MYVTRADLELRPVLPDDRDFLLRVYEAAREIELSMAPWEAATKRAFIEHQFNAQTSYYETEYPNARHDVLKLRETGEPTGRLYVDRSARQIAILDVTVLPEFRRRGIGSAICGALIEEARASGRAVQVYVESFNPSQQFFLSRGFTVENDDGFNVRLVWRANTV
jgi:ribosomal protein S18 acetylase RimI-like enzyme